MSQIKMKSVIKFKKLIDQKVIGLFWFCLEKKPLKTRGKTIEF